MFASVKTPAASDLVSPKLEVISRLPSDPRSAPPILFVHGAWHAAWCWDEFFLSHFAAHGFEAHARAFIARMNLEQCESFRNTIAPVAQHARGRRPGAGVGRAQHALQQIGALSRVPSAAIGVDEVLSAGGGAEA